MEAVPTATQPQTLSRYLDKNKLKSLNNMRGMNGLGVVFVAMFNNNKAKCKTHNGDETNSSARQNNIKSLPPLPKGVRRMDLEQNNVTSMPLHRLRSYSRMSVLFVQLYRDAHKKGT